MEINKSSKILFRNTILNIFGQVVPLGVAIFTIPFIINKLGVERFSLYSLSIVILGYFSILDFGMGRTTTKFIAEEVSKGKRKDISRIFWTSILIQLVLGIIGGAVMYLFSEKIMQIFKISDYLKVELIDSLKIVSFSLPFILPAFSLIGTLEAFQRFDIVNYVKVPFNILTYLAPIVGVYFSFKLPGIVFLLLLLKIVSAVIWLVLCIRLIPELKKHTPFDRNKFKSMLKYGGWTTVSNVSIPVINYFDRIVIGASISTLQMGYYTVPYDFVSKLGIIPASMCSTLFPAFSGMANKIVKEYFLKSLKYLMIVLVPILLFLAVFSKEILNVWVGPEFALNCHMVFKVICISVFTSSISQLPANILEGIGRPDLKAKILSSMIIPYFCLLYVFITFWGIVGAAIAWTMITFIEFLIFTKYVFKVVNIEISDILSKEILYFILYTLLLTLFMFVIKETIDIKISLIAYFMLISVYFLLIWSKILNKSEILWIKDNWRIQLKH